MHTADNLGVKAEETEQLTLITNSNVPRKVTKGINLQLQEVEGKQLL